MINPCQTYTGITGKPAGILRRFKSQEKKSTRLRWGYDEEITTDKIDKRLHWRLVESRSHRPTPVVTTDEKIGVRCMAPVIFKNDQTNYFELAPEWSIRNREGKWSEYALYIHPRLKAQFEAGVAAREIEERMEFEREVKETRISKRVEAERVALASMARRRDVEKKNAERVEAERVALASMARRRDAEKKTAPSSIIACPACTFHNPRGSRVCEICNSTLV